MAEKMEVISIEYTEIQAMVAQFLGLPEYDTLSGDMSENDYRWGNDTTHLITVDPAQIIESNHAEHLADVRRNGKVEWSWELAAVLDELARQGDIEAGNYLINVCW